MLSDDDVIAEFWSNEMGSSVFPGKVGCNPIPAHITLCQRSCMRLPNSSERGLRLHFRIGEDSKLFF